ncbi:MAG TPA: thioredoxin domain-containing protein [Candidatus Andersenbacteria bacterium]|nr:thioredoxin domain-containing protein [Candidatus Andersenbacteria bacterium]
MPEIKQAMSIPAAIVIAGALIAGAVYFSKVGPSASSASATNAQVAQQQQAATPGPVPTHFDIRAVSDSDHVLGDKNAPVTLVEYSDLECPYCKLAHPTITKLLQDYSGKIRVVYRHAFVHQQGPAEANAAECANAQGKFSEFVDTIFANTPSNDGLNLADLPKYAQQAGVADISAFNECVKNSTYKAITDADNAEFTSLNQAMDATGNPIGTPFFILIAKDGKETPIIGAQPYQAFQQAIEKAI